MGPIETASIHGYRYAITFIGEYTKHAGVNFMKFKSEALEKLKQYVAEEGVPEKLRSDYAKEYKSQSFESFITILLSCQVFVCNCYRPELR